MNGEITNIINSLADRKDWIGHIITCLSVFFGAYFAYIFANRQERQKDKKLEIENYNTLWNKVALSLNNLFTYKEVYLDRTKKAFEKDDFKEALQTSYVPDCDFSFDEKTYFLNTYNRCFLTELALLSKINDAAKEEIKSYYQNVFEVLYILGNKKRAFSEKYELLKRRFMDFYNQFEHLCARAYYIDKEFTKGFEKYFNSYCYEGVINNLEIEAKINERIRNEENINFIKQREALFDIYWQIDTNIYCNICVWIRKLKHSIRRIINFFKIPKICKTCRCRKIKIKQK